MSEPNSPEAWAVIQDMLSHEGKLNPWPRFAQLHALGDVFETPDGSFFVVGYNAAVDALRSPAFGKGNGAVERPPLSAYTPEQLSELDEIRSDATASIVMLDPPYHTKLRDIVQAKFTPRYVRKVEEAIPVVIDRLLSEIDPSRPADIIGSFSAIFAPEIMAELIGLPSDRREHVSQLTADFLRGFDPACPYELQRDGALAGRRHRDYIREVVAERRACPVDDFVDVLVQEPDLGEREKITLLQTLYLGGYGTTAHMIGNGLVALLQAPEQFALLKAEPHLLKAAIEEMLRFDGAISLSRMLSLKDTQLAGVDIPAGRYITVLLAAANRDPDVFPDPDRFNITRRGKPHLSFAGGAHYCLGVNLARLELEQTFARLVARFPDMTLADPYPPRSPTFHQQSFEQVMVVLGADHNSESNCSPATVDA